MSSLNVLVPWLIVMKVTLVYATSEVRRAWPASSAHAPVHQVPLIIFTDADHAVVRIGKNN